MKVDRVDALTNQCSQSLQQSLAQGRAPSTNTLCQPVRSAVAPAPSSVVSLCTLDLLLWYLRDIYPCKRAGAGGGT